MIRFLNPAEQRKGAQTILRSLEHIPAIHEALIQIEREAPLEQISTSLRTSLEKWLEEQSATSERLKLDLHHEQDQRQWYEKHFQRLQEDPLQNQLKAAQEGQTSSAQRLADAESALARSEETLKRERRGHAREVQHLQAEIAELNRLIAKQHLKLQELTGAEPE